MEKINFENFLFSSFVNTEMQKLCCKKIAVEKKPQIDLFDFYNSVNLPTKNTLITAEISELLFTIIWLKEEDQGLSDLVPSNFGVSEKYGCDSAKDFIRHMRNSIAHKRCDIYEDFSAEFRDCKSDGTENFNIKFNPLQFELLKEELRYIAIKEFYPMTIKSPIIKRIDLNKSTKIGDYAFCGNENLEIVTIDTGATEKIPKWAFCNCKNLNYFVIPTGVKSIEKRAFSGCKSLEIISIPTSVVNFGDYCFAECENLSKIIINANSTMGRRVFSDWKNTQKIIVKGTNSTPTHWNKEWNQKCSASISFSP